VAVAFGRLLRPHGRGVQQEWITLERLPADGEDPPQRYLGGLMVEVGRVQGGQVYLGDVVDDALSGAGAWPNRAASCLRPCRYADRMAGRVADEAGASPAPPLAQLVRGYGGSRIEGAAPGLHRGLPSRHLELTICLGDPIELAVMPDPSQPPGSFAALVAGLQTGPAVIAHNGSAYAISVQLTAAGARSLLGVPAGSLATTVVSLDAVLGRQGRELAERLAAAPGWPARFALLDEVLTRRIGQVPDADPAVAYAWQRIVDSGGPVRIGDLAVETGLSRQHLTKRFRCEFGLGPKQVARVVRFERSSRLLRDAERWRRRHPQRGRISLAELAARCGYYDQAHLAQEWNELAGCPPSAWLAAEELPFVQAESAESVASSPPWANRP
jgi:AraC-like DNA-binding protein